MKEHMIDLYRLNRKTTLIGMFISLFKEPGYRFIWLRRKYNKSDFIKLFIFLPLVLHKRKFGIEISSKVKIGVGFVLLHPYNITVSSSSIMGDNITLCKGVTIGNELRGTRKGSPKLCNNIYVGVNATVVGKIRIGNNVLIAPNAYVNKDVPDNSVVFGNPAIIKHNESATDYYLENILLKGEEI